MKKFIVFFVLFLFVFQIALAANSFTITGKVKGLSIKDNWIILKVNESILYKFTNIFKKIFNKDSVLVNEYRINIMNDAKIEGSDGKVDLLENIQIGETISVTGVLITEMTNKDAGLMEAKYIKTYKSKNVVGIVTNLFSFGKSVNLDSSSLNNYNTVVVKSNDGASADSVLEQRGGCVGYGKPIVINTIFAPKVADVCCGGLKEIQATFVPYENKIVNIGGFEYTIRGYCYNADGLVNSPIVFKNDSCISEGEPILGNTLIAPKMPTECCKDLNICGLTIGDNQSITINGFSYIIKGYCRKECPAVDYTKFQLPFGPEWIKKPTVSLLECVSDKDCCNKRQGSINLNAPCNLRCDKGKCVDNSLYVRSLCTSNSDCILSDNECVVKSGGFINSIISWFSSNNKGCKCDVRSGQCMTYEVGSGAECNSDMICDSESIPVCGIDGKDYSNPCEAVRCNTKVQCSGKCPCKPMLPTTTKVTKPGTVPGQCSDNGDCSACEDECFENVFLNQLKNTGKICGVTSKNLICECKNKLCIPNFKTDEELCSEIDFVCGVDNKTYQNKCEIDKEGVDIQCEGTCPCDSEVGIICPTIYQPVCGINGKTYSNHCEAQNVNIPLKCMTACPCATTTTTTTTTTTKPAGTDKSSDPINWEEVILNNGFCGEQTGGTCTTGSDCAVGGCSGTICYAKNQKVPISTCEFKDCYSEKDSSTYCGCKSGKCQWYTTTSYNTSTTVPTLNDGVISGGSSLIPGTTLPPITIPGDGLLCTNPVCGDGICHEWERMQSIGTCYCAPGKPQYQANCTMGGDNFHYCPGDCQ